MAENLLEIISPRLPEIPPPTIFRENKLQNPKYQWIKISEKQENIDISTTVYGTELCINGEKINMKYEQKFDKIFLRKQAAELIGRNLKMWLAKIKLRKYK